MALSSSFSPIRAFLLVVTAWGGASRMVTRRRETSRGGAGSRAGHTPDRCAGRGGRIKSARPKDRSGHVGLRFDQQPLPLGQQAVEARVRQRTAEQVAL